MSLYYTDEVEITPVTRDNTFKVETRGVPFTSEAFVEDERKNVRDANGTIVDQESFIFLPNGTNINKGDYIRITKLHGDIISSSSLTGIEMKVTKTFNVGSFKHSHIEVECSSG